MQFVVPKLERWTLVICHLCWNRVLSISTLLIRFCVYLQNEQTINCVTVDSTDNVVLLGRTVVLIRTIKGKSYQIVKYLTMLLLFLSLSVGIFIIVDDHGHSLTSKDDYLFLQQFYKAGKEMLDSQKSHRYDDWRTHETHSNEENNYFTREENKDSNNDVPDKIILIPKIVAQAVISVIDVYGMGAVFFEHFYSVRDLVGFMSFLNLYLLLDYSQQFTPIRLVIESFALIALISFAQRIKPLPSRPLFPCACDPAQFIVAVINSLIPCSCCSCCSNENYNPGIYGQHHRLEKFKMYTSAAILISMGGSIYTFYSLYPQVDGHSTAVYVTAIGMNSIVSIYGFVAILTESYRSLNGHFSISLTCAAIISILALRLSPTAAWLLLPLAISAFSVYILTCLLRVFYGVKDEKPYAACKIFLLFWLISTLFLAPAFIAVTCIHYTEEDQIPTLTLCVSAGILFILQCLLLYGTLKEKYVLLNSLMQTVMMSVGLSVIAGMLLRFVFFKDTNVAVIVFVVTTILATLPIIPFFKYFIIELKLFNSVMSEDEIWFIHRQARKFFDAIQLSHTVGSVCTSGLQFPH